MGLRQSGKNAIQSPEPPAAKEADAPIAAAVPAVSRSGQRFGGARKLGAAAALLIAVAAVVLLNRDPARMASTAADVARDTDSPAEEAPAVQSAPAGSDAPKDSPKAAGGNAVPPAPGPGTVAKSAVQAPPSNPPAKDQGTVVAVQGFNPAKPAAYFWAISKAPSVLYKKRRQDPAEGTRIDIPQGATESIAFAKDEIFRVANGRDIEIYFQGRKVAQNTIESGAWMSFVPLPPGGASDKE